MKKKPIPALLLLVLPTVVVTAAVTTLMKWRMPTRVEVELTVTRAGFTVGGQESTPILNVAEVESVTVEKFARVAFNPEKLEVADPAQYLYTLGRYPETAWTALTLTPPVAIIGEDETLHPAVTFERASPELATVGTLDRVWARPGAEAVVEFRSARTTDLTLRIHRQESAAVLSFRAPFRLLCNYCRISGITGPSYRGDALAYRARLPTHSPMVEVAGQPNALILVLTIAPGKAAELFSRGGIPVTTVDFTRQSPMGGPETAVVGEGSLAYPDYPGLARVSFKRPDFIVLSRLRQFRIEEIALDPTLRGMRLRLRGVAGRLWTGSRVLQNDRRLTRFDALRLNTRLMVLVSVIVWVFPTTVGAYRLYQEFKNGRP